MSHVSHFLSRIADDRRRRVAEMKLATPPHVLRARLDARREGGRLERALRRGGAAGPLKLLCEVKRASPSKGMLNEDVDPVALAKVFAAGGAAAISLVTEPDHFKGDLRWMDQVRPVVSIPLLLKDFVIDSYQLLDAAVRGADGVLLLAALLSETELQRLIGEAKVLGVDPLVEVHDARRAQRRLACWGDPDRHQPSQPAHVRARHDAVGEAAATDSATRHRDCRERRLASPRNW